MPRSRLPPSMPNPCTSPRGPRDTSNQGRNSVANPSFNPPNTIEKVSVYGPCRVVSCRFWSVLVGFSAAIFMINRLIDMVLRQKIAPPDRANFLFPTSLRPCGAWSHSAGECGAHTDSLRRGGVDSLDQCLLKHLPRRITRHLFDHEHLPRHL